MPYLLFIAVACASLVAFQAMGQQVLAPPPVSFSGMSPSLLTTGTNQPGAMPPPVSTASADEAPFKVGPAQFRPHLMYRFLYGDGVPAAPGDDVTTAINELYPGILIMLGNHWFLDYTPTLRYYSSSRFRDTLDHNVILTGGTVFQDWTLGFSQSYSSSSQPLVETGTQTDQENFATGLNATYQINTATSLELGANQSFRFIGENQANQQLTDSMSWSTMDWLNYQFTPRLGAALGVGFTYDDVSAGGDMTSEQLQGRVTWRPGEKLFVSVSGGAESRQFLDSRASNLVNPLFGLSAQYQIFESTSVSVGASQTISPSYEAAQITEASTISGGFRQRLIGRLFLDLSGGFTRSRYTLTVISTPEVRDDKGTFFSGRLSTQVLRRGTLGVFYSQTDNDSNRGQYSLSSKQVGVELGYKF